MGYLSRVQYISEKAKSRRDVQHQTPLVQQIMMDATYLPNEHASYRTFHIQLVFKDSASSCFVQKHYITPLEIPQNHAAPFITQAFLP